MTLFGQFFDHGLDLVTKGGNGTVYIPLKQDDPLYDLASTASPGRRRSDGPNFMALTRSTPFVDPVTGLPTEAQNTTTPFIDQNQTYTSHASHQVFLREYKFDDNGDAVNTGKLLNGVNGGIANWAEVKAQALTMLGIELTDFDVNDVPLLKTDIYGKFIPGANGFAQYAIPDGLGGVTYVEANGGPLPGNAVRTGHAFLNDIAHHAAPVHIATPSAFYMRKPPIRIPASGTTMIRRPTTTKCSTRISSPVMAAATKTSA